MTQTPGGGAHRWNDPDTSKAAARSIKVNGIMWRIMKYLSYLPPQEPRNGWEMSKALVLPTITVVPRLAPMRRKGLILLVGKRPGPSLRGQRAYILTVTGKALMADTGKTRSVP